MNIGYSEQRIINTLHEEISQVFDSVGLLYRIFYRVKSAASMQRKMTSKQKDYSENGKKIQDLFGIRVTVYFLDDLEVAIHLIKGKFRESSGDHSIDGIEKERFGPIRCNLIFYLSEDKLQMSSIFEQNLIDNTFEIQFRTIFSEGWHEVEHDMRYKCKDDWLDEDILSRQLNSQLAVLESCDWTILKIFDEMAFKKYKTCSWASFFRNIMRIRMETSDFSDEVKVFLDHNSNILKDLLKKGRVELLLPIASLTTKIPLTMDTVLFVINRSILQNIELQKIEGPLISEILHSYFDHV